MRNLQQEQKSKYILRDRSVSVTGAACKDRVTGKQRTEYGTNPQKLRNLRLTNETDWKFVKNISLSCFDCLTATTHF